MKNAIEPKTETHPVRELMPKGFTRMIAAETGYSIPETDALITTAAVSTAARWMRWRSPFVGV